MARKPYQTTGKKGHNDTRRGQMRPLSSLVPGLTKKAIGKRGFTTARIITEWSQIVGPELARQSRPEQLRFPQRTRDQGILTIRVDGPLATELLHLERQVIERINAHFGYQAVARLRLVQAPLRASPLRSGQAAEGRSPPSKNQLRSVSGEEERHLQARFSHIEDPALKERLIRLGRAVIGRTIATNTPDNKGE